MGIIATLTSIAVPTYSGYRDKVNNADATARITGIELIIDRFYAENGRVPHNLAEVGKGGLLDPWGNTYEYLDIVNAGPGDQPRKWGPIHPINTDYDLYSKGKDGESIAPLTAAPSRDDIVRARDGQYVGLVSDI